MICTTTGFYATGSSAVTDVVKECEGIWCYDDYEIRFIHDPDGISDLEYNLIENPNRHNTSNAIKRFKKSMEMLDHVYFIGRYRKHLGKNFLRYTYEYINDISELEYYGSWHFDIYERGKLFYFFYSLDRRWRQFAYYRLHLPRTYRSLMPKNEKAYLSVRKEKQFLEATRNYIYKVLAMANRGNSEKIFIDQLIPPSNIGRYVRYFKDNDLRVVLVDRDPRDIYILEKYVYAGRVAPVYSVDHYCKWYRWVRETSLNSQGEYILRIQFEDLIYNYDKTVHTVLNHFGIDEKQHTTQFKYFSPGISVNNTQTWLKYPEASKEIEEISQRLSEFCYDFPPDFGDIQVKKGRSF